MKKPMATIRNIFLIMLKLLNDSLQSYCEYVKHECRETGSGFNQYVFGHRDMLANRRCAYRSSINTSVIGIACIGLVRKRQCPIVELNRTNQAAYKKFRFRNRPVVGHGLVNISVFRVTIRRGSKKSCKTMNCRLGSTLSN